MDIELEEIGDLLKFIETLDYSVIEVNVGDVRISVRRGATGVGGAETLSASGIGSVTSAQQASRTAQMCATGPASEQPILTSTAGVPVAAAKSEVEEWLAKEADGEVTIVRTPMVGTFYRAKEPGVPPFVEIGGIVEAGDVVCLIEAMKLFNSVSAGASGIVEAIFVEDGAVVEYQQPLVAIRTR